VSCAPNELITATDRLH